MTRKNAMTRRTAGKGRVALAALAAGSLAATVLLLPSPASAGPRCENPKLLFCPESPYMIQVGRLVSAKLRANLGYLRQRRIAKIALTVDHLGALVGADIVESSGDLGFDQWLAGLLLSAAPFPPFPAEAPAQATFLVPITMDPPRPSPGSMQRP
jgi:hypothetical protein